MVTLANVRDDVDEILPGVVADRRYLHENPELGFQEFNTARFVAERLEALGVEDIRTGVNITGVTGLIRGTGDGPGKERVVLARADMDALPILEENDVDYRSKNDGVMHACGHDAHTSMLLGTARVLMDRRDQFAGTVKLLFQPSEEAGEGGAIGMIREGVMEDPHVDACFGLHVSSRLPTGKISVASGPLNAAADEFRITIQGKGGHGAYPHLCVDPVLIGSHIVVALQTLVSREVDPTDKAVVSVCAFKAGDAFNVIPDTAMVGGTVRTFNPDTRDLLDTRIHELVTGIATSMGGSVEINYRRGYPPVVNDQAMAEVVREAAREVVGEENVEVGKPKMGAEDFSYFAIERPGCFFNVGTGNPDKDSEWSHHHPRFDIDEDAMAYGIATMATTLVKYLARED
ncbi:MAG TPA: amidohydrolase [Thermomicrobiales bacterium]|nr:amidohydrolase [Thermomicrobiales bacterium]